MGVIRSLIQYRELLYELTLREIKSRYKQSILGYAWVILNPFFQMLVLAVVFSQLLRIPNLGVPYPIYLYVGLLPWFLLSNSLIASTNVLLQNSSLITKVYFPRELLILSTILAKVVDFFLASSIFILFLVFFRVPVTLHVLWFFPIFLIQFAFTYGLSLLLAAFNLFYRDVQYVLGLVVTLWMYLTPIVYSVEMFPQHYRWIFQINPMAVLIHAYREAILSGSAPQLSSMLVALGLSSFILLFGLFVFRKLEGVFADVI